jgi:cytochrome c2
MTKFVSIGCGAAAALLWQVPDARAADPSAAAGSKPEYLYSPAQQHSGGVWSEATLDRRLADPKSLVPDNKMAFVGLPSADDRRVQIEYVRTMTSPK